MPHIEMEPRDVTDSKGGPSPRILLPLRGEKEARGYESGNHVLLKVEGTIARIDSESAEIILDKAGFLPQPGEMEGEQTSGKVQEEQQKEGEVIPSMPRKRRGVALAVIFRNKGEK